MSSYQRVSREDILCEIKEALPGPEDRMTAGRKEAILKAIQHNILKEKDALKIYGLSEEELESWIQNFYHGGRDGLKATKTSEYRHLGVTPMRVAA